MTILVPNSVFSGSADLTV